MPQVTLQDVATASGVSAQTVSRVVNQRPDVSDVTRAHVWETVRRLGYKPNVLARGLVSQRSHSLGVITLPLNDYFRAQIVIGLEKQARAMGYACQMSSTSDNADDLRELIDAMLARQVDGIVILTPKRFADPELLVDVPIVTVAHSLDNPHAINVDVDNVDGAYQAMCYLLEAGHRAIGQRNKYFYMVYNYSQVFDFQRYGYGVALSWIFFVIVLVLTLIIVASSRYWVHYEVSQEGK